MSVTDNGHGIWRDDLELLCERHATSKLSSVECLREIRTFGFRGEALASCAQVARVEVITKRKEAGEPVAWRANYLLGKMQGEPEPLAGNEGTIIHVSGIVANNIFTLLASDRFVTCFMVIG